MRNIVLASFRVFAFFASLTYTPLFDICLSMSQKTDPEISHYFRNHVLIIFRPKFCSCTVKN